MKKQSPLSKLIPWILVGAIVFLWFTADGIGSPGLVKKEDFTSTQFARHIEKGDITNAKVTPKGEYTTISGTFNNQGVETPFSTTVTTGPILDDSIRQLQSKGIDVTVKPENTMLATILINIIPFVFFGVVAFFLFRKMFEAQNKSVEFSDSKERLIDQKDGIKFKDVAGCDEEKSELVELVDYLKNPKKYDQMGARIPKGVLLVGPPGNGKTMLARAVSGEASVPFFSISGSEFIEMFAGVGASRVRKLFQKAKKSAPAIIFIDEIDAVGRQRGTGFSGGDREGDQTLNQLLVELDGMDGNSGVIIIAATNRSDVLDPALLRPGRFDRQIKVNLPTKEGRVAILNVHARNKKLGSDVDFEAIAKRTMGFSGAELENLLNEAAILAVRGNKKVITMELLDEAIDRVMMGPAKTSKKYTEREKRLVAYHEAGHAVIGLNLENSNEVQKITIVQRGDAGGYNLFVPKEENYFVTQAQFKEQIAGLLGGRAAEQVALNEISSGAYSDLQKVTQIARGMVTKLGMSKLGNIQFEKPSILSRNPDGNTQDYSEQVAFEIDREVKEIVDNAYALALKTISENRTLLDNIANALIEYETLNNEEILEIFKTGKFTKKVVEEPIEEPADSNQVEGQTTIIETETKVVEQSIQTEEQDHQIVETETTIVEETTDLDQQAHTELEQESKEDK